MVNDIHGEEEEREEKKKVFFVWMTHSQARL